MQRSTGPLGYPSPAVAFVRLRGVPCSAVPATVTCRVDPLVRFASSPESSQPGSDRRDVSAARSPSMRFCVPIATLTGRVHVRGPSPRPASFRPRRFARPRRLAPLLGLRVPLFGGTLLPRPGFALQGVCLPHRRTSSSLAVTLAPFAPVVPGRDLRVVLDAGIRRRATAIKPRAARSPPELHLPRALLRAPPGRWLGIPSVVRRLGSA